MTNGDADRLIRENSQLCQKNDETAVYVPVTSESDEIPVLAYAVTDGVRIFFRTVYAVPSVKQKGGEDGNSIREDDLASAER